ncbi:IclR family transcriptional regulator [Palleronia sp. LCG004]|uniref:IclR family transcriptional regulator n=1 Tax=Palleronia sp. LCG004 TaxID=3079304 RepID=UPI0029437054|nr:IclR family transcriptional regulator C-terminal domain-containing protein [Palleronia sp. LCG004]WOI57651.1 IclR family transcriptional regulator C-terminal domain-containing protein [Palleronia sp. LCG004]
MSEKSASRKADPLHAGTLAKGIRILRAFDEENVSLSLSDLVRRTGLEKSAAQRLAHTLHVEGMLEKDPVTRRFRPSHAWLQLAYAYYWSDPLIARALPRLIEFSRRIGETVNLAQMSGDHIIYSLRLPNQRTHFGASIVGRRLPAIATAAGRAMLSTWPEEEVDRAIAEWPITAMTPKTVTDRLAIREDVRRGAQNGYVITRNQMILNEVSIAAPVKGMDGRAEAAVQVSVSGHAYEEARIRAEILPFLHDAANGILA